MKNNQQNGDYFEIKINASGSWANFGRFNVADQLIVCDALEVIVQSAKNSVKAKLLNEDGEELLYLSRNPFGYAHWIKPIRFIRTDISIIDDLGDRK